MKSLSVVIITYNEERNIGRCLQSLEGLADEVIVVDSLSTDRTEAICRQYGVTFISQSFLGYIEQKNFAVAKATNDIVLSLDADEMLSDVLRQNILSEKEKGFKADGYTMNRCTNFCGKWIRHGSWYPDTKLRLMHRNKGSWGGVNPHDKIEMSAASTIRHLKGDILHYSYYSIEEVMLQNNKFTTIQAQAMFQQGRKATALNLVINPLIAFINGYFIKGGFMDGRDGFFIAFTVAYHTLVKYRKLMRLQEGAS